jgi:hypothetical protein
MVDAAEAIGGHADYYRQAQTCQGEEADHVWMARRWVEEKKGPA